MNVFCIEPDSGTTDSPASDLEVRLHPSVRLLLPGASKARVPIFQCLQGAKAVSAYVTHGVFPNESHKRFSGICGTNDCFENFWITDSCPQTVSAVQGVAPFKIISLAGTIAAALHI